MGNCITNLLDMARSKGTLAEFVVVVMSSMNKSGFKTDGRAEASSPMPSVIGEAPVSGSVRETSGSGAVTSDGLFASPCTGPRVGARNRSFTAHRCHNTAVATAGAADELTRKRGEGWANFAETSDMGDKTVRGATDGSFPSGLGSGTSPGGGGGSDVPKCRRRAVRDDTGTRTTHMQGCGRDGRRSIVTIQRPWTVIVTTAAATNKFTTITNRWTRVINITPNTIYPTLRYTCTGGTRAVVIRVNVVA